LLSFAIILVQALWIEPQEARARLPDRNPRAASTTAAH